MVWQKAFNPIWTQSNTKKCNKKFLDKFVTISEGGVKKHTHISVSLLSPPLFFVWNFIELFCISYPCYIDTPNAKNASQHECLFGKKIQDKLPVVSFDFDKNASFQETLQWSVDKVQHCCVWTLQSVNSSPPCSFLLLPFIIHSWTCLDFSLCIWKQHMKGTKHSAAEIQV